MDRYKNFSNLLQFKHNFFNLKYLSFETASLVTLFVPVGAVAVGPLMDLIGRKTACLVACVPSIISWILCIFANSISLVYWARCIAGFAGGLSTVSLVYTSEIAHPQMRPMLLCFDSVFVSLGILITYCLRAWCTWNQSAIVFLVINICISFMLLVIPETPYWIMCFENKSLDERNEKVERILRKLNKTEQVFSM